MLKDFSKMHLYCFEYVEARWLVVNVCLGNEGGEYV
jgi:hypothetical protein